MLYSCLCRLLEADAFAELGSNLFATINLHIIIHSYYTSRFFFFAMRSTEEKNQTKRTSRSFSVSYDHVQFLFLKEIVQCFFWTGAAFAISYIQSTEQTTVNSFILCPATSLADATLVGIHWRMRRRSLLWLMILYQKPCQIHQQGGRRCWMATCGVRPKGLCRQPLCRLLLRVQTLFDFQNNFQQKNSLLQRGSWHLQ